MYNCEEPRRRYSMKNIQVLALVVFVSALASGCMTGGAPYVQASNRGNYGSIGLPGLGNYSWNGNSRFNNTSNYKQSSWSVNNGSFRWDGRNGGVYWGNNGSQVAVPSAPSASSIMGMIPR